MNSRIIIALLLAGALASCTKSATKSKSDIGFYSCCIDYGCTTPKKTVKCEDALAAYIAGSGTNPILTMNGFFPDGSAVQFVLSWQGNSGSFKFGISESNLATYFPKFPETEQYTTPLEEESEGVLTITEYDQTNQRITGTYNFKGIHITNNNVIDNTYLTVSGSFTNIPIWDPGKPETYPCK